MDIALKLVVNYKFEVIISRTQCNCMTWLLHIYKVTCSNLVFYYQLIHKHFDHKRINL